MRALAVAAEPGGLRAWVAALRKAGLATDGVRTRAAAVAALVDVAYDAVVIDRDLSDGDGLTLLSHAPPDAALVVVTGPQDRSAIIAGGVDDALTPPFRSDELVLRVSKALVRRTEPTGRAVVSLGAVVVDRAARTVTRDGRRLRLTPTGLCVLDHLVAHRHRLVPAGELLDHCWDARRDLFSDPLPSQLNRLRAELSGAVAIRWVDRGGYLLDVEGTRSPAGGASGRV